LPSGEFSSEFKVKPALRQISGGASREDLELIRRGGERITGRRRARAEPGWTAERNCVPPRCPLRCECEHDGLQIFAAGGAEAIDKIEGDLRVEDGLTRGWKERSCRVCDSSSSMPGGGFGDGTEKISGRGRDRSAGARAARSFAWPDRERKERRKSLVFVGIVADPIHREPNCTPGVFSVARKVDYGWPRIRARREDCVGECCGASEEDEPGAFGMCLLPRLDDGRLAACFRSACPPRFLRHNERSQLAKRLSSRRILVSAEQGRRARKHANVGIPSRGHESRGPRRSNAMAENANDLQEQAAADVAGGEESKNDFGYFQTTATKRHKRTMAREALAAGQGTSLKL